jgi:2-oxo-4-hydroxy-4-carboxy-5-ureidoimidazoline decarboxylase
MRLEDLNALDGASAAHELQRCCGSTRWAEAMAAARPFASADAAALTADRVWALLDQADWREAFAAHPRIGERTRSPWEAAEQSGVENEARAALQQLNRDYEARFGYMFIVCATGKSAAEIVARLEQRLGNNPEEELRAAAEEQRQITRLRLARLLK